MKTTHPASAEGIEKYLASGAIRSIGPKYAAKIVAVYKERTLTLRGPAGFPPPYQGHRPGTGQADYAELAGAEGIRKIMLFLADMASVQAGLMIDRTYGQESIAKIKENPYQLADDIRGIGFKTADQLAAKMGIDRNSLIGPGPQSGTRFKSLAGQGHVGYPSPAGRTYHQAWSNRRNSLWKKL